MDASLTPISLAVLENGQIMACHALDPELGAAEHLVPAIGRIMRETGFAFADLDRIGVATGPGPFIAVRAAVAAARALALAANLPVCGAPSLPAIARQAARAVPGLPILAVQPIGSGEWAGQAFSPDLTPRNDMTLLDPQDFAAAGEDMILAGRDAQRCMLHIFPSSDPPSDTAPHIRVLDALQPLAPDIGACVARAPAHVPPNVIYLNRPAQLPPALARAGGITQ